MNFLDKLKARVLPTLRTTDNTLFAKAQTKRKHAQITRKQKLKLFYQALNNLWVSRCCQVYIDTTLAAGYTLDTETSEQDNPQTQYYLQNIFQNPEGYGGDLTYDGMITLIWKSYLVLGDCFFEAAYDNEYNWTGLRYIPNDEIYWNTEHDCYGLTYQPGVLYEPHELIHIYKPSLHGKERHFGTSIIEECGASIALLNNALRFNNDILHNKGLNPGTILSFDKDISTQNFNMELERINAMRKQADEQGGLLALRGATFESGIQSNKDMSYMELMKFARDNIISAFGVPPQKVEVIETANLGAGTGESQDKNWKQTFEGASKFITTPINQHLKRAGFNERYKLNPIDIQDKLLNAQVNEVYLRNGVFDVNEVRNELGLDPKTNTWGGYYR